MKVIGNLTKDAIIRAAVSEGQTLTQAIGTPVDVDTVQANISAATFDSNNNKVVIAYSNTDATHRGKVAVGTVDPSNNSISFGTPVTFFSDELESSYLGITFDSSNNKVVIAFRDITNGGGKAIVGTVSGTSISFGTAVSFTSNNNTMVTATFDSNSNKVVIVYKDQGNSGYGTAIVGTVSGTSISFGSATVFESATTNYPGVTFDSSNNKVVIAYRDAGNSGIGTSIVGTVSGTSISFGSAATFNSENTTYTSITFDSTNNKIVAVAESGSNLKAFVGTVSGTSISFGSAVDVDTGSGIHNNVSFDSNTGKIAVIYQDQNNSNYPTLISGAVSGTSISFGSSTTFESSGIEGVGMTFDTTNNKVVISYADINSSFNGTAVVGTVSGTSISFGTPAVFESGRTDYTSAAFDSSNNKVVISYTDKDNSNHGTAVVATVSGTSISFGSVAVYTSEYAIYNAIVFDSSVNKVVISYRAATDGDKGKSVVGTVSGTSISFGSAVTFASGGAGIVSATYDTSLNKVLVAYNDKGNSNYGTIALGSVSGTSISFAPGGVFESAAADDINITYDANANKSAVFYYDEGNSFYGTASVFTAGATNLTAENYIGMSSGVVDDNSVTQEVGSTVIFNNASTDQIAAAYDANTQKVVIVYEDGGNSGNGTAIVGTVSGSSVSFGTPAVFETSGNDNMSLVYDANSQKVVIAYRDSGNSSFGTAVVGTVSGTGISFGTPVVFESATTFYTSATFDSNANKVVIAYKDNGNSNYGTAIVGTVSGTAISFGSAAVFESASSSYMSATFDSNSNKVVIAYQDGGNSDYGTAIVGTVSGTSISFGTAAVFESATTDSPSIVFDSNSNKVVIVYRDDGNSMYGTAIVGTVSGTSISFGSAAVFESARTDGPSIVFDSNANKVVISYEDEPNSNYGTIITGTVSGESISFDVPIVFEAANTTEISSTFVASAGKVLVAYKDVANSNKGSSVIFQTGYTTITRGQVADGGNAEINIKGAVAENQNGLTAGQSYYVQTDGTLSTTAGDPSVFAGTAVAATKLIVKG